MSWESYIRLSDGYSGTKEQDIEDVLMILLDYHGHQPRRQVHCPVGIADIVTNKAIYEIKYVLNRHTIFQALGQVLLYRACICPEAQPVLVGHIIDDLTLFQGALDTVGVSIQCWPHGFGLD